MEQPKRQLQDYFEGHFSLFSPPEENSFMDGGGILSDY